MADHTLKPNNLERNKLDAIDNKKFFYIVSTSFLNIQ